MQYVALLRGINVNGQRMIRMEDLRTLVAEIGCTQVRTLLQSGNVLLRSAEVAPTELAGAIERALAERLGLDVAVFVLTVRELAELVEANPLAGEGVEPRSLYVTVLPRAPDPQRLEPLMARDWSPDRLALVGRCAYVHCPNGYHGTKLTNTLLESRLGAPATTRSWNTMLRLVQLAGR